MADVVRQAGPDEVDLVAPLFDAYRQFYQQPSDVALARTFLAERLARAESVVFLAERGGRAVGFVQLYPLFSSTTARPRRLWLLNDLFVAPEARGLKIGGLLLEALEAAAQSEGVRVIRLETGVRQPESLALYRRQGYTERGPFGAYQRDPLSTFFEKWIG